MAATHTKHRENEMTVEAWWFAPEDKCLRNGDGRKIRVGQTHVHKGVLRLCRSGLHASKHVMDALEYAPGPILCRVECGGEIIHGDDKLVCTRRKYLAVVDGTDLLKKFARMCALDVIDKWDAPDVVVRYLKTGDEGLRDAARDAARGAAWDAAWAAAWAAAWDAAWDAARAAARAAARDASWDAARAATRKKQRNRLTRMVSRLIRSQG